jgi:hypothetical protein
LALRSQGERSPPLTPKWFILQRRNSNRTTFPLLRKATWHYSKDFICPIRLQRVQVDFLDHSFLKRQENSHIC